MVLTLIKHIVLGVLLKKENQAHFQILINGTRIMHMYHYTRLYHTIKESVFLKSDTI